MFVPIHVREMVELAVKHPAVYEEYLKGNFIVQKCCRKFSIIAKDQSHEKNEVLQGNGGASDLYDVTEAIVLYMLADPDCVRMIEEFESVNKLPMESTGHNEEAHSLQCRFLNDVHSFVKVVNGMGNPFLATGHELITLDTRAVMDDAVPVSLSQIHDVGQPFTKNT